MKSIGSGLKGFSLVQLMVSLAITAVIAIAAVSLFRSFQGSQRLIKQIQRADTLRANVQVSIQKIADSVPLVDGVSSSHFPSLLNISNPEEIPQLQMIREMYGISTAFRTQAVGGVASYEEDGVQRSYPLTRFIFNRVDGDVDARENFVKFGARYLEKALSPGLEDYPSTRSAGLYAGDAKETNYYPLVPMGATGFQEPLLTEDSSEFSIVGMRNTGADPSFSQMARLAISEKAIVKWVPNDQDNLGQIVLEIYRISAEPYTRQVLVAEVRNFQLLFSFRPDPDRPEMVLPPKRISHIEDPAYLSYLAGRPGVTWKDVLEAYISYEIPLVGIRSSDINENNSRFIFDPDGSVYYRVEDKINLPLFLLKRSGLVSGNDGELAICPRGENESKASRCRKECVNLFDAGNLWDPDPLPWNWIGYGKYVGHSDGASDYCRASTYTDSQGKTVVKPAEDLFWGSSHAFSWREVSTGDERYIRMQAAVQHFGPALPNVDWNDSPPGWYLAVNCFQPQDVLERAPENSTHRFIFDSEKLKNLMKTTPAAYPENPGFGSCDENGNGTCQAPIDGSADWNFLSINNASCKMSSTQCDLYAEDYYRLAVPRAQRATLTKDSNRFRSFSNKCRCENVLKNESGDLTNVRRSPGYIDWMSICNLRHRADDSASASCPSFFMDSGSSFDRYIVADDNSVLGLSQDQAMTCECLYSRYQSNLKADPNFEIPNVKNFDFRSPINWDSPPDPVETYNDFKTLYNDLTSGLSGTTRAASPSTFGTTLDYSLRSDTSTERSLNVESCAGTWCSQLGSGLACCSRVVPQNDVVNDEFEAWAGYCSEGCSGGSATIDPVRRVITGTAAGDQLPTACGGSTGSGGGDGNGSGERY